MSLTIPAPKIPSNVQRAEGAYAGVRFGYNVYKIITKRPPEVKLQNTPWRPVQWKEQSQTHIIDQKGTTYVFDAVLRGEHTTALRLTEHPVQSGANIVDHAYQLPERLVLEVGMSDVMDSYNTDQWQQYSTKSVSAYQKLKELQYARLPLSVMTRLNFYENMVIENIHTSDDNKTLYGLRCTVTMRQILAAQVKNATVKVSKRPQTSKVTKKGTLPTPDVDPALMALLKLLGVEK